MVGCVRWAAKGPPSPQPKGTAHFGYTTSTRKQRACVDYTVTATPPPPQPSHSAHSRGAGRVQKQNCIQVHPTQDWVVVTPQGFPHHPAGGDRGTGYGGYSVGETPGPIPNPEAKTHSADGTAPGRVWESRTPPDNISDRPRASPMPGVDPFKQTSHCLPPGSDANFIELFLSGGYVCT